MSNSRCWTEMSESERRQHVNGYVAFTPGLKATMGIIQDLYASWREAPEGDISFVMGETRAGKTTSIDEFIIDKHVAFSTLHHGDKEFEVQPLGDDPALWSVAIRCASKGFLRPIVKVQVSKKPRFKSLFADVLTTMGIPKPSDSVTEAQRLNIMITQFREQQTRIMVFDDCHHISEYRDPEGTYDAGDVFKIIAKCCRTGVLCIGLPHMMELVDVNAQVRECERTRHTVGPFKLDLAKSSDLMQFMAEMNKRLPFDHSSCLCDPDIVLRIFLVNEGFTGRIARFVQQVNAYGLSLGVPCIDLETLQSFMRDRRGVEDKANIFLVSREALDTYPTLVDKARKDRIHDAEKRRAKQVQQDRKTREFGRS